MYRLAERIGAGGMGEVYRAHDTTLGRDVAVKLLPPELSSDPDRSARLEREARLLATLNHPFVATIHGFDTIDNRPALILELVEGPTLAERIARGRLSYTECCELGIQIASALEAAHDRSIVHRDLKPANIKLTQQGHAKVLDFGLAKLVADERGAHAADALSTLAMSSEAALKIAGTPAYMSPEQARGEPLDRTTDIWAFGCVLFELLTGVQAFRGSTVSDILSRVLQSEPPWQMLPAETPIALRLMLGRCLQKDRRRRLQYAADARVELEQLLGDSSIAALGQGSTLKPSRAPWLIAAGAVAASLAAIALIGFPRREPASRAITFEIPTPDQRGPALKISPDGHTIAYQAAAPDNRPAIWLRALDSLAPRMLPGTEDSGTFGWSPDSRSLVFAARSEQGFAKPTLKKIDIATATTQSIADDVSPAEYITWGNQNVIVFPAGSDTGVLRKVPVDGGAASDVTSLQAGERYHTWPSFLPDGRHFLFLAWSPGTGADSGVLYVGSTDPQESRVRLMDSRTMAVYAPPGYLLYGADGRLMARPFDASRLRFTGDAFVVVDAVNTTPPGRVAADVAADGTLIYRHQPGASRAVSGSPFVIKDARGIALSSVCGSALIVKNGWRVSPDGNRVALFGANDPPWVCDLSNNQLMKLSDDPYFTDGVAWSPDGSRIVYGSLRGAGNRSSGLFERTANAATSEVELVPLNDNAQLVPLDWSLDGQSIVFSKLRDPASPASLRSQNHDLWIVSTSDRRVRPYVESAADEIQAAFSPDGHYVAYASNGLSNAYEVVIQPFPNPSGGKWKVSARGGCCPRWNRNGSELFYVDNDRHIVRVPIKREPSLSIGTPQPLEMALAQSRTSTGVGSLSRYDVMPDGQRFIVDSTPGQAAGDVRSITVLLNWTAAAKR